MSLSMYQASVPVFMRMLRNLAAMLEKAAAHCEAKKIDPAALLWFRLYPDMFTFARQVQAATEHAKNGMARISGVDAPVFENVEKTIPELIERVRQTIAYLDGLKPEQVDGSEAREIVIKRGETVTTHTGQDYLLTRTLPNFYFHVAMAYAILRHNGVEIGKRVYLGS